MVAGAAACIARLAPVAAVRLPSGETVSVPPRAIVPLPDRMEPRTTLVKLTVGEPASVIISSLSVAFASLALLGVPPGMMTESPAIGTWLPDQLPAVFQSLLTLPV